MTEQVRSSQAEASQHAGRRGPVRPTWWQAALLAPVLVLLLLGAFVLPAAPGPPFLGTAVMLVAFAAFTALAGLLLAYLASAPLTVILALFCHRDARRRSVFARLAVGLLLGMVLLVALLRPVSSLRMRCLAATPARAKPLTAALDRYRQENGKYPLSLKDLTPRYLDRVPATGLLGYPTFEYRRGDQGGASQRWLGGSDAAYDLWIDCSLGFVNFDTFHYWPSGNYPEKMWGGVVERVDGWAYVHE